MDYDLAVKLGTLLVGAIGTWKLLVEFMRGRQGQLREEYKFARDFIADLQRGPDMHPFLKQKGFQAIAGDSRLKGAEIEYLLTLQDPAQALEDFVQGKRYLQHLAIATDSQVTFRREFERVWPRWWRKAMYLTLYFACYFLGFAPAVLPAFKLLSTSQGPCTRLRSQQSSSSQPGTWPYWPLFGLHGPRFW